MESQVVTMPALRERSEAQMAGNEKQEDPENINRFAMIAKKLVAPRNGILA
jgi:hypothetical protein